MKKISLAIIFTLLSTSFLASADELNKVNVNPEYNFYTGVFDFSDDNKRAGLVGIQHLNEELNRDTFLGNLSPITGVMLTEDAAGYLYTGVQANYEIGKLKFNLVICRFSKISKLKAVIGNNRITLEFLNNL